MLDKKRTYIGLLILSLIFILLSFTLIWFLLNNKDVFFGQIFIIALAIIATIAFLILGLGTLAIIFMIIRSKTIPSLENITQKANDLLFPLTIMVGKLVGIPKERILRSFIAVNNYLIKSKHLNLKNNKIMILAPHCLQHADCPYKITIDVFNCKQCGKCTIGDLITFAHTYNVMLVVASGGTLARKFIKDKRPQGVIAIACERDLSLGIQDTSSIPVIGVLNSRPNGPCYNTKVSLDDIEKALKIIKEDDIKCTFC
ncbi:putative nucleotide-binding protein [Candidatus Syntrophocurvum alkaliphilum]|uniref:Putative nucleotide-binding protein n=1 Tax=Candidatus Syntrophocurvum alkaliphilum TaxID=2293317 RepID=A0A6I6DEG8_9FIRM|nr:DUF116 domain-containing protein [Candidatus Syntrophocurvum alkaliphilum]QGT99616.1 putative nucleotide-binding protein [Candidatus Syntrophocurvum alkaliphilum]